MSQQFASFARIIESNVLLLVCILPFLVPFGLTRNIGLQGLVVTLTGLLAWFAVWLRKPKLPAFVTGALITYVAFCLLSLIGRFSQVNLLGGALMRLGSLELISCVGIGLCLRQIDYTQLLRWLYISLATLGVISLPYSIHQAHHLVRIGGLLHQPDFLAVVLAVGFLLGIALWRHSSRRWRLLITLAQAYLLVTIFLTQTRAVILILFLVLLICLWQEVGISRRTAIGTVILGLVLLAGSLGMRHVTDGRLTDESFASESISYRLDLQSYGVKAALHKPILGYGAYGVTTALACSTLHADALLKTCQSHYYFDSSHNIYLDRFLELGWLGGISFVILVAGLLWYGFRRPSKVSMFAYGALVIALYYFTNVSGLEIETVFWIMLFRCLPPSKPRAKIAS